MVTLSQNRQAQMGACSVVDERRVLVLLRSIEADLAFLRRESDADAVRMLGRHGVVEPALGDRLARDVGFRNVLVHEYIEVDDSVVLERLADHDDLDALVAAVPRWLRR